MKLNTETVNSLALVASTIGFAKLITRFYDLDSKEIKDTYSCRYISLSLASTSIWILYNYHHKNKIGLVSSLSAFAFEFYILVVLMNSKTS